MITFCFVHNKPANVEFVWDDAGPGLHVTWCEDSSLTGFVVRDDSCLKVRGMFQTLCESLIR